MCACSRVNRIVLLFAVMQRMLWPFTMRRTEKVGSDKMTPSSIYRIVRMVGFQSISMAFAPHQTSDSSCSIHQIVHKNILLYCFLCLPTVPMANQMDLHQSQPPGLIIIENFIAPDEEDMLINLIESKQSTEQQTNAILKHRHVKHFGYEFRYDTNNVDVDEPLTDAPIPSECDFLWHRLRDKQSAFDVTTPPLQRPHQLTANLYEPGQGAIAA